MNNPQLLEQVELNLKKRSKELLDKEKDLDARTVVIRKQEELADERDSKSRSLLTEATKAEIAAKENFKNSEEAVLEASELKEKTEQELRNRELEASRKEKVADIKSRDAVAIGAKITARETALSKREQDLSLKASVLETKEEELGEVNKRITERRTALGKLETTLENFNGQIRDKKREKEELEDGLGKQVVKLSEDKEILMREIDDLLSRKSRLNEELVKFNAWATKEKKEIEIKKQALVKIEESLNNKGTQLADERKNIQTARKELGM